MKNKKKFKNFWKTTGLVVLGIATVGALSAGIAKIVQVASDETKAIKLNYSVGGLNEATGKYEECEYTLYTKEKFACYGLRATLDFDAQIKYQIFYYDVLDNYISASNVLENGYSGLAPINGAYARIEITPLDNEDDKISLFEKIKYSNQLSIRVAKDADSKLKERFTAYKGRCLDVVNEISDSIFEYGLEITDNFEWKKTDGRACTSQTILSLNDNNTISVDYTKLSDISNATFVFKIFCFEDLPTKSSVSKLLIIDSQNSSVKLDKQIKYVLISIRAGVQFPEYVSTLANSIEVTKTK